MQISTTLSDDIAVVRDNNVRDYRRNAKNSLKNIYFVDKRYQ